MSESDVAEYKSSNPAIIISQTLLLNRRERDERERAERSRETESRETHSSAASTENSS
jgi:hypothetical protein